jgi:hypothetical protein
MSESQLFQTLSENISGCQGDLLLVLLRGPHAALVARHGNEGQDWSWVGEAM